MIDLSYQTKDLYIHPLSPSEWRTCIQLPFRFMTLNATPFSVVNKTLYLVPGPERILHFSLIVITDGILRTRDLYIHPLSPSKSKNLYHDPVFLITLSG